MKLLPAIALACWGVAHVLIMICVRHLGAENTKGHTVEYGLRTVRRLKHLLPPKQYKLYVLAQILFVVGLLTMGSWGLMGLLGY